MLWLQGWGRAGLQGGCPVPFPNHQGRSTGCRGWRKTVGSEKRVAERPGHQLQPPLPPPPVPCQCWSCQGPNPALGLVTLSELDSRRVSSPWWLGCLDHIIHQEPHPLSAEILLFPKHLQASRHVPLLKCPALEGPLGSSAPGNSSPVSEGIVC